MVKTSAALHAGLDGWNCRLTADTIPGQNQLERTFARVRVQPGGPDGAASSRIQVSLADTEYPRISVRSSNGGSHGLGAILCGPEWKGYMPLQVGERTRYIDLNRRVNPALECLGDAFSVLDVDYWPVYAWIAFKWLLLQEQRLVHLHAAVLSAFGQAMVLVGPSGVGKSTLAWALHQQGAVYFGDESALFTVPEYRLRVLPHTLRLRPGGVQLLQRPPTVPGWYRFKADDPKCSLEVPPPSNPCPEDQVTVFILSGFGERPVVEPIKGEHAVRRLFQGMAHRDPTVATRLEIAADLAERHPVWQLTVGRPEDTASLLLEHLRSRG